jgi:two-component system, NarL family, sensor histidine kinase DegS
MADEAALLADQLAVRRAAFQRELDEIELLMQQARTEADRHATRRDAAAERLRALFDEHAVPPPVREAHEQLILQHQRSALMSSQTEVLEGKQRVLERLQAELGEVAEALVAAESHTSGHLPDAAGGPPAQGALLANQSGAVLTAQEEMRRAIARQMHDGPAQSIANIALQAEVVQRLMERDPAAAERELGELRQMVQHALEATKTFIFDVRPMILDDLGLVPTLRRATSQRQRSSGLPVRFESVGADRRLDAEVETQLFRIVDDALAGLLAQRPMEAALRLNWTEDQLAVVIRSRAPAGGEEIVPAVAVGDVPSALAGIIRDQSAGQAAREEARRRAYGLPAAIIRALEQRARSVDIALATADGGLRIEATVTFAGSPNGGNGTS